MDGAIFGGLPVWLQAGIWGLLGAASLIVGAAAASLKWLNARIIAGIMSFGCGVLISAVAYDLIFDGFKKAGIRPIVTGAIAGSLAYGAANWLVSRHGAHHRKRSTDQQKPAAEGGGLIIAIGSLLDGIPESVVLGVSLLSGGGVSVAMFAAIFLSNFPEGLSSAVGMRKAGRSSVYIYGLWTAIALLSGLASLLGAAFLNGAAPNLMAMVNAIAAGALLTMVSDTMLPEAVQGEHGATGFLVVVGLLLAFSISQSGP